MARARTPTSILKSAATGQPKIYAEGKNDRNYLNTFFDYEDGMPLKGTEIEKRIVAIKQDIFYDDAIECVIWIVDGGDQHIKKSKPFIKFYKEWMRRKNEDEDEENDSKKWKKLHILINTPCLEYWFLLHRTDPPIDAKKGVAKCFENATAVLDSPEFKKHCPEGKGGNLVSVIANDAVGRNQAIKRAKSLGNLLVGSLGEKNLLEVARAEMYQIFSLIKGKSPR